jgi:hypothetical protein
MCRELGTVQVRSTPPKHQRRKESMETNSSRDIRVYELVLCLKIPSQSLKAARSEADDMLRREGLEVGFLQVFDKGPEGDSSGRMVYSGRGNSDATLDAVLDDQGPQPDLMDILG